MWAFLEVLADPDNWAVSFKNGEIYIESIEILRERGVKVR